MKVDKGLKPLANTSESWCQGLDGLEVGRCRLTVSKPVLTAPVVSALEARIS